MAAQCTKHLNLVAGKGICLISDAFSRGRGLSAAKDFCLGSARLQHSRTFYCRHGTAQCARTRPEKTDEALEPQYIPKRKAKNPMVKIGYAWMIGLPSGIIGFLLAKREVDKNRLKQLKVRQRMKKSNEGAYESDRYGTVAKEQ